MAGTSAKQKSVRNMVLSLAVTILAAGVVYLFIPHDEDAAPEVPRVDYRVELLTARRAAAYPIVAPEGLAREWKATSVRFRGDEGDAWHLGFHAPDGEYVQIEQSTQKPKAFIDEATQGARATKATQEIAGRNWTRWTGGRYDALVLKEDGATTVVAGTGSFGQLAEMAGALKAK